MRLFIGGVMQGSQRELAVCDQHYRQQIAAVVQRHHPEIEIVDPLQLHPDSVSYTRPQAVQTFLALLDRAADADILVAFLPEASMGTAIEVWHAYRAGKPVIVISPLANNWVLWATATHILPDLDAFSSFVAGGGLLSCLATRRDTD